MADTNETITDIVKRTRAEADYIEKSARGSLKAGETLAGTPFTESDLESALGLAETKRKEADRLEAALKHEKAAIEADALAVGGIVEAKRKSERGDYAKLCEALEDVLEKIDKWRTDGSMEHWQYSQLFDIADAALAATEQKGDNDGK